MPPIPLISSINLTKSYGTVPLFEDLSLTMAEGNRIGLIGPNGSGKSTLLRLWADLEPADDGEIARRRGLQIHYVPQDDQFAEGATVGSNSSWRTYRQPT